MLFQGIHPKGKLKLKKKKTVQKMHERCKILIVRQKHYIII